MTDHWTLTMTCPRDGYPLVLENVAGLECGYRLTAILKCTRRSCTGWQMNAELVTIGRPPPLPAPLKEAG